MKLLPCLAFLGLAAVCTAQSDDIPIFDLDDYYVEPKMNLSVGFRGLTGPKAAFSGSAGVTSVIQALQSQGDPNATGIVRDYHDGYIDLDTRKDADGNPINDGRTNTWGIIQSEQITADGYIAMHTYTAEVYDNNTRSRDLGNLMGTELIVSRDMGKIGSRIEWKIFAGLSIDGVSSSLRDSVLANVTTLTDLYSLNGQTPPTGPYTAPSSTVDADGNTVNTTILLGQKPDSRTTTTMNDVQVASFWRLKGSYVTFRVGPTVTFNLIGNLRLSLSGGPAMAYVGTNYTIEQTFVPETGQAVTNTITTPEDELLQGYYFDGTLEYLVGEHAGFYLGAFYQANGDYTHDLSSSGVNYSADLDLNSMQGFRAGMNFKF
jgi:hypothetical protein